MKCPNCGVRPLLFFEWVYYLMWKNPYKDKQPVKKRQYRCKIWGWIQRRINPASKDLPVWYKEPSEWNTKDKRQAKRLGIER